MHVISEWSCTFNWILGSKYWESFDLLLITTTSHYFYHLIHLFVYLIHIFIDLFNLCFGFFFFFLFLYCLFLSNVTGSCRLISKMSMHKYPPLSSRQYAPTLTRSIFIQALFTCRAHTYKQIFTCGLKLSKKQQHIYMYQ